MNGRMSLVEQKRLQWAREREEMARLSYAASWGTTGKPAEDAHAAMRTRMSALADQAPAQKRGCPSDLGSPKSLGKIAGESHLLRASLISLHDTAGIADDRGRDASFLRRRSPSLPPIYTRESGASLQRLPKQFGVDQTELRYHDLDHTELKRRNNYLPRNDIRSNRRRGSPRAEDLEGETSGYASDSADVPLPAVVDLLPISKPPGTAMSENGLQDSKDYNCRYGTPESSLPPSRRLSAAKGAAEVRPRWGSLWGQELIRGDPPPPSWLERGLSRMDHTSQVLVINHESASSPDSSTNGSAGSDSTKTYLRGQNVPLDEGILLEREARRQKALELQSAIKDQLEQRDRQRKEEKQQRFQEERAEEERIERERVEEKRRFEEEQRRLREKENTKLKKAEAMRQVLEAAERLAKEEKRIRRKRIDVPADPETDKNTFGIDTSVKSTARKTLSNYMPEKDVVDHIPLGGNSQLHDRDNRIGLESKEIDGPPVKEFVKDGEARDNNDSEPKSTTIQVPVSTEIAIVLSGRLQDPEIFNGSNLKVNLVVTPSPTKSENVSNSFNATDRETLIPSSTSPAAVTNITHSRYSETDTRLLTPSKYRTMLGREFGTQTDLEDLQETVFAYKPVSTKERKESLNANQRDIEKSTNTGPTEELAIKTLSRSKGQSRSSLEARPRWNANRPGTRYRTQSEKDPHYQRRLRLRRRQVDSSDEGSRSPSPERRKPNNLKFKGRNAARRKMKLDSYDADLSMDSLNSIVPLRVDKNGRINIENNKNERKNNLPQSSEISIDETSSPIKEDNEKVDSNWCGREILSQLTNLRNGLAMKQKEWDSQRCLVSPSAEFY